MPPKILVRALEPDDIPALTEAWNQPQAFAGTLQLPFTSVDARRRRNAATPDSLTKLVAEIDRQVVGSIYLDAGRNRRAHAGSVGMAVHDGFAGQGVGSALMTAAVDLADNWLALRRLELTVYADNARAIGLYERFGFVREGLHRDFAVRAGRYVDAVPMARLREAPLP